MVGLEEDPFLLGFGNFSGVNSLLNFGGGGGGYLYVFYHILICKIYGCVQK